ELLGSFCPWLGAQGCWRNAPSKLQEARFGSGLCATRGPRWRNARFCVQVCLWPLSFAQRAGGLAQHASAMLIYRLSAFLLISRGF
ncbi:hypothetical protein A2U01_0069233, partial [Trifolium medium]|nr:hypothetical protein [Trifolium medium]